MNRVSVMALCILASLTAGCSSENNPAAPSTDINNSSYSNLYGDWTSATANIRIDDRSMTFTKGGAPVFYTYVVRSTADSVYALLISNGEEWFVTAAGNTLSIQPGIYAGTYTFAHP